MNKKNILTILIFTVLIIGVVFYLPIFNKNTNEDGPTTHVSQYFQEADYVENQIANLQDTEKLEFKDVLGGVAPHHIPTAIPLLAEFYLKLQKTKNIDTFIILAPDHFDKGNSDVSISKAEFITPFGKVLPDLEIIKQLEDSGLVVNDEAPFNDHSIHSQLLFISRLFPNAKVVPMAFRSSSTNEFAELLGEKLASLITPNTFIVASVDFSHYLNEKQARILDDQSASILTMLQPKLAGLTEADSPQSLVTVISAVNKLGANLTIPLGTFNSSDYSNIEDYTTGYVIQFYGIKNEKTSINSRDGTILFVGDIMLSRSIGDLMERKGDYNLPFINLAEFLRSADLTFGNLEGPISSRGVNIGSTYSFRADPRVVEGLRFSGFDVLSIANNHVWDYGRDAFTDTLMHLKDSAISYVGGGANSDETHAGIIKEINGTKIGFLAYTDLLPRNISATLTKPGVSFLELEQVKKDIVALKPRADILVVSFHWGEEYKINHNQKQEHIAKSAIDAGADLIIGHHPHVIQEVEQYKDGWIAYSLGNFIFDQNFSVDTRKGLILVANIGNGQITSVERREISFSSLFQPFFK